MGHEYIIRAKLPDGAKAAEIISRLENPRDANGWTAFTATVDRNGYYFCDNNRSKQSAFAFRKLIDYALLQSDSVVVEEP